MPSDWPAELVELQALASAGGTALSSRVVCEVACGAQRLPVLALTLGNPDPAAPALGIFGGVHGLERIGAEVALAFVRSLLARLRWDAALQHMLEGLRVVCMPLVNPGGLVRGTRANPRGVDLMRNAPLDCLHGAPPWLGGQRFSSGLPWYRGAQGAPMEAEAQALCQVVEEEPVSYTHLTLPTSDLV